MNTRNSIVALGIDHLAFRGKGYVFSLSEKIHTKQRSDYKLHSYLWPNTKLEPHMKFTDTTYIVLGH